MLDSTTMLNGPDSSLAGELQQGRLGSTLHQQCKFQAQCVEVYRIPNSSSPYPLHNRKGLRRPAFVLQHKQLLSLRWLFQIPQGYKMDSSETMKHTWGQNLGDTLCFFLGYHPYGALIFLGLVVVLLLLSSSSAMKFYLLYVKEKGKSKPKFDVDAALSRNAGNACNRRSDSILPGIPTEREGAQDHAEAEPARDRVAFDAVDMHDPEHHVPHEEHTRAHVQARHTNPLKRQVFDVLAHVTHTEWLEWLKENWLQLWESENFGSICTILLKLADEIQVLQPGNKPCLGDYMDMRCWRKNLDKLILEMDEVVNCFPPDAYESGPCVLTKWRYGDFLRMLAQEILSHGERMHGKENK